MSEIKQARRPMVFFWSIAVYAFIGLFWSIFCIGDLLVHPFNGTGFLSSLPLIWLSGFLVGPLTMGVGVLILRRQPHNVVAVLVILIGESMVSNTLRSDIDIAWINLVNSLFGGSIWAALFLLVPYFPDGRMYPPRYSGLVSALAIYFLTLGPLALLGDSTITVGSSGRFITMQNPYFIPLLEPYVTASQSIGVFNVLGLIGLGLFSLARRYRDGDYRLRAQVRWLIANMALFAILVVVGFSFNLYTNDNPVSIAFTLVFYTWLLFFPLIGISYAILRHRLYDIDIIIRRTLVYSVLTGVLATLYFGAIILTQQVFRAATGQTSDLAIVFSTLLIAALFSPIRRRVQDGIDRRLYRRKYDVEQTLADFQKNLREDVDMDTLKANLIGVVSETMQPDKIALWVQEDRRL